MRIRQETAEDYKEVYRLIAQAFQTAEHADGNEQDLVAALRKGDAFLPELSLVAEVDGELAGHILFTKAKIGREDVLALAPLSVKPSYQGRGVGTALVTQGHKIAKESGYSYCVVLGSETYYPRFGYVPASQFGIEAPAGILDKNFMAVKLQEDARPVGGPVIYAKEFGEEKDMQTIDYVEYMTEETKKILAIDSPSGFTREAADYVMQEYRRLGYEPVQTVKGGVLVALGGKDAQNAVMLEAHIDTLGAMVSGIKSNGRLKVTPVGGMNANNAEAENCRIHTRSGGVFDGTLQLVDASIHVNGAYNDKKRTFDEMEVVLDERVHTKEDAEKLGIMAGDFVCFDARTTVTKSGYIKSRFLDDKLSVGILLGYARYLKEEQITPERMIYQHITVYEEVGHGGAASIPEGVTEVISVDMGCVGEGLACEETQVSICAKDSRGPYNYDVVSGLICAAKKAELDFAVDVYPYYGSDADVALTAGYDVRHGLIGAGVYASHGYERSHVDGVKNTFELLKAYLG